MNLLRLTLRNIAGSPFRSAMVFLCVALVAASAVWATLIVEGAKGKLRASMEDRERLGVDISVVIRGSGGGGMGMGGGGAPPPGRPQDIAEVPGVAAVSAQLQLTPLDDATFFPDQEVFLRAFDPATDFLVMKWLADKNIRGLEFNEAFAGSEVSTPPGDETLVLFGYELTIAGRLAPTGTPMDKTIFVTFETARHMLRLSRYREAAGLDGALDIYTSNAPVVLVKVRPGSDPHEVSVEILNRVPGVVPFESTSFFEKGRSQMAGLLESVPILLGGTWILSVVFIALVFSVAVNERRREIGVLRALGATRRFVLRSVLAEGHLLALGGGALGVVLSALVLLLFRDRIIRAAGVPLLSPSPLALLLLALGAMVLALASVTLAAFLPAFRISRQDPATTMKG